MLMSEKDVADERGAQAMPTWERALNLVFGGGPSSYRGATQAAALASWRGDALSLACPLALTAGVVQLAAIHPARRSNVRALEVVHEDLPEYAAALLDLLDVASGVAGAAVIVGALLVGAAAVRGRRHHAGLGAPSVWFAPGWNDRSVFLSKSRLEFTKNRSRRPW